MTELFEPTTAHDPRLARGATGLLAAFNAAGVVDAADVHVAERVAALGEEPDEQVRLAVALAVRAVRHGSVGVALDRVAELAPELPWPDPAAWSERVAASPLTGQGVLRHDLGLVYLDRYHRLERQVADDLLVRTSLPAPAVDAAALAGALGRVRGEKFSPEQEAVVRHAAAHRTTVITGGPGTGKTTTVARVVLVLAEQFRAAGGPDARRFSVALAAPTGKAATRLQEAVTGELAALGVGPDELPPLESMTLHRLLGWRPDNTTRFRHHRGNRLKHDLIVVDESSMVELTMMARLLEAVRPDTRLVLVGDPDQLTSVGAGAVLNDLVEGFRDHPDSPVAELAQNHRSTEDIKALAAALRGGDPDQVLAVLRTPSAEVELVETDDPADALRADCTAAALRVRTAAAGPGTPVERAAAAIAALDAHRLLCAHRDGPYGVRHWNRQVEQWLADEIGTAGAQLQGWYVGRPLLVTSNDYALDIYNGETGVAVADDAGRVRAFVAGAGAPRSFAPGRLDAVDTMHAMTIHKSQGSQAAQVTVLLPEADSRLLTRELFYTAVTRAQQKVRIVGTEAAVRAAVTTTAQRATGLRQRLAAAAPSPTPR